MNLRQRVYPLPISTTREASDDLAITMLEKLQRTIQLLNTVEPLTVGLVFLFLICLFSVEDLFRFVEALGFLVGSVGDFVASDFVDLGEGGFEVEARLVDVGSGPSPVQVFGLDSQSSIVRFEAVDVYVTTGALVGSATSLVPGVPGIGWLGLRFRFKPGDELVGKVEEVIGGFALVRSGVGGRVFDGSYNEEAVRDEVRTEVEVGLVRRSVEGY